MTHPGLPKGRSLHRSRWDCLQKVWKGANIPGSADGIAQIDRPDKMALNEPFMQSVPKPGTDN